MSDSRRGRRPTATRRQPALTDKKKTMMTGVRTWRSVWLLLASTWRGLGLVMLRGPLQQQKMGGGCRHQKKNHPVRMGGDGDIKRWFEGQPKLGPAKKSGGGFGGSGWSSTSKWALEDGSHREFFVKTSSKAAKAMFAGEAEGLRALRAAGHPDMAVPEVLHCGDYEDGRGSFIVMEYLRLGGRGDSGELGRAMAKMHLAPPSDPRAGFGFAVDNTIGATPQPNDWMDSWPDFFRTKRLEHQVNLAGDSAISRAADRVLPRIDDFFADLDLIKPSILHGDLWSGNIGSANGKPAIFDPACYYGHHEAEWGMSWCASLGPAFWQGYRTLIPEDPLFRARRPLYEAYHQINHYNLFGGGYRAAAVSCLEQALKALDESY